MNETIEPAADAADQASVTSPQAAAVAPIDPAKGILVRLQTLPDVVIAYVYSDELVAVHQKVFDQHGLSPEDRDAAYYLELQVFLGEVPLDDFADELFMRLSFGEADLDKSDALALDILGYVFLPAQAHLGDVADLIVSLGGDVKKFPENQLAVRRISYVEGAKEIASAIDLEDGDADMQRRLAHIIETRLRHVREDADIREVLMKPKKTGGMELPAARAAAIVELIKSKMRMTSYAEVVSEEPVVAPSKSYSPTDIKRVFVGTAEEQLAIEKRMDRFRKVTEGDVQKMRDAFYQVIEPEDGSPIDGLYVVAGLLVMADGDHFAEALEQDERYRNIIPTFLRENGREAEIEEYEKDPLDSKHMNLLLQYLVQGVAGFPEADASRFALRYLNVLKQQKLNRYSGLVAFDTTKGAFRWTEPVEA